MIKLLQLVFGCTHNRLSFPLSPRTGQRRNRACSLTGCYVVCLDCGKEFPYDWSQMKIQKLEKVQLQGVKECVRGAE